MTSNKESDVFLTVEPAIGPERSHLPPQSIEFQHRAQGSGTPLEQRTTPDRFAIMRHLALLFAVIQIAGCAPDVTSHLSQISKVQGTSEQKPGPINNWLKGGIVQRSLAKDKPTLTFHKITPGEGERARVGQSDLRSGSMLICPGDVSDARLGQ